jgi:hypothetical protein
MVYTKTVIVPVSQIGNFMALCDEAKVLNRTIITRAKRTRIYEIDIPSGAKDELIADFEAIGCEITEVSLR